MRTQIALGALLLAACNATGPYPELDVGLRLTSPTFHAGDFITGTGVVVNTSTHTVTFSHGGCLFVMFIESRGGDLIGPKTYGCTGQIASKTLEPGDSLTVPIAYFDSPGSTEVPSTLTPGDYRARTKLVVCRSVQCLDGAITRQSGTTQFAVLP